MKKFIYIFAFLILAYTGCPAAKDSLVVKYETNTRIQERHFDKQKLEKVKADPDFKYEIEKKKEQPSWIDKILYRIARFIFNILFNPTGSAESIFFYIICGILILVLAYVILRMTKAGIFSRNNKKGTDDLGFSEVIEDINSIDFDKMIEEAVKSKMYRRAVRLYYLKSLKQLSDKSQIIWEINKTNRDYMYELKSPSLRTGFENITFVYERVWYGNMDIDSEKFTKVKSTFHQFYNQTASSK